MGIDHMQFIFQMIQKVLNMHFSIFLILLQNYFFSKFYYQIFLQFIKEEKNFP